MLFYVAFSCRARPPPHAQRQPPPSVACAYSHGAPCPLFAVILLLAFALLNFASMFFIPPISDGDAASGGAAPSAAAHKTPTGGRRPSRRVAIKRDAASGESAVTDADGALTAEDLARVKAEEPALGRFAVPPRAHTDWPADVYNLTFVAPGQNLTCDPFPRPPGVKSKVWLFNFNTVNYDFQRPMWEAFVHHVRAAATSAPAPCRRHRSLSHVVLARRSLTRPLCACSTCRWALSRRIWCSRCT